MKVLLWLLYAVAFLISGDRGTCSLVAEILNPFAVAGVEQMDILGPEPEAATTAFFKSYGGVHSGNQWNICADIESGELVSAQQFN